MAPSSFRAFYLNSIFSALPDFKLERLFVDSRQVFAFCSANFISTHFNPLHLHAFRVRAPQQPLADVITDYFLELLEWLLSYLIFWVLRSDRLSKVGSIFFSLAVTFALE